MSTPTDSTPIPEPEQFRSYLRLLARLQMPAKLQPRVDASDLVQQTLAQAYRALDGFRGKTRGEMAAWLRQILAHNLAHGLRDQGRQKRDSGREVSLAAAVDESAVRLESWLAAEQTSPSERAQRHEQLELVAAALETLPDEQREAIELHYWQGWTLAEVGEHQGRSTASVAGLVHRGLAKLREQLGAGER